MTTGPETPFIGHTLASRDGFAGDLGIEHTCTLGQGYDTAAPELDPHAA